MYILGLSIKVWKKWNIFFRGLLISELCCRIPCNWKYIYLFLIGDWTTTSWRTYHQAFSVTILSWSGCKFGVSLNIGVRGTHGHQSSKQIFECVGAIAYYGLYPNRTALTLGLGKSQFSSDYSPLHGGMTKKKF